MKQTYSVEFKEQALSKVLQRGSRTVGAVADRLNVNVLTLRNWMRGTAAANRSSSSGHARRPEDWSLEERPMALQESHGLADEALNGWCRERGLFAHHLVQWRADFCAGGTDSVSSRRRRFSPRGEVVAVPNFSLRHDHQSSSVADSRTAQHAGCP